MGRNQILKEDFKDKISKLPYYPQIVDNWGKFADQLPGLFEWKGSKIDWSSFLNHKSHSLLGSYYEWIFMINKFLLQ